MADKVTILHPNRLVLRERQPHDPIVRVQWKAIGRIGVFDAFSNHVCEYSRTHRYAIGHEGELVGEAATHQEAIDIAYRWAISLGCVPVFDQGLKHLLEKATPDAQPEGAA